MPSHCCHIYGTCRSKEVPCEGRGGARGGRKVVKSSFMESTHEREPIFMVEVTSLDTIMEVPTM